jgi:hypothetical protein
MPISGDQIPTRGLTGGEGKVRGKVQELTRSREWPVFGKRGTVAAYRRRTETGGGSPRDVVGVPVAGGQEGSGGIARKLPQDDVVLMVGLAGARGQWIAVTTTRPSDGGSSSSPALWSGQSSAGDRIWVGL